MTIYTDRETWWATKWRKAMTKPEMSEGAFRKLAADDELLNRIKELEAENTTIKAHWNYIKTEIDGARLLLSQLREGRITPEDFDTMVDRIIESRGMKR